MYKDYFDNKDRHRYYGLRVGDTVTIKLGFPQKEVEAEVIDYGAGDNNRVKLRLQDGSETDWVAEWCVIVKKVEEKS